MAFNRAERSDSPMKRRGGMRRRKKVCVFCGKDNTKRARHLALMPYVAD